MRDRWPVVGSPSGIGELGCQAFELAFANIGQHFALRRHRRLGIEEDGDAKLVGDHRADLSRQLDAVGHCGSADWDEWDDVDDAHSRMRSLMLTQVDMLD